MEIRINDSDWSSKITQNQVTNPTPQVELPLGLPLALLTGPVSRALSLVPVTYWYVKKLILQMFY